jgi:acetaldehyde/propanal dehydrogenase
MIDLTPAPSALLRAAGQPESTWAAAMNVNMVTCGGQATIPMVAAVSRVQPVSYGEIVATVSKPRRPRHAQEHRRVHPHHRRRGREGGRRQKGKAIIIINPAEPPLIMRDTVHCLTETEPDRPSPPPSTMMAEVQKYVPGYKLVNGPVFDGKRVSVFLEVEGLGDYLPKYAGNLDIMTAAAARTAEMFAEEMLAGR